MTSDDGVLEEARGVVAGMWQEPVEPLDEPFDGEFPDDESGPPAHVGEDAADKAAALRAQERAEQASYFAGAPEWAVLHPSTEEFANATWRDAPEIQRMVDEMLRWDELKGLRDLDYRVRWRRKSTPFRRTRLEVRPILAGVVIVPQRYIWEAYEEGVESFPRILIDIYWGHWEDRRKAGDDAMRYVHRLEVQKDIHRALLSLDVREAEIKTVSPDVTEWAATVERFRSVDGAGMRALHRQLPLIPRDDSTDVGA